MSSSESEEFESADESFEDDKSSSKISKEVLNNRGKNIISKNLQSAEKGNEPRIEPEESKVDLIIGDLEKDIEEEIVKAIEEIVKEEREEIISKQTDEKNKAIIEIIAQTPEDNKNEEINTSSNSTPDFQADGWEFDNWGEEDLPKDTKSGNIKTISTAKTHSAEKKDDSIELDEKDDWDFEDWGDGNISEMESNSVNKSLELESGPVLKNIANSQPQISGVFDKLTSDKSSSGWGSWGNVASFLSSASESVASLTTNVSKGISNVIESGIGVPDPTELAKIQQEHEKKLAKQVPTPEEGSGLSLEPTPEETLSLNRLVSGVTQISNRVITGGLDTLEGIGKKTMNILQENDPLLLNKRKMLGLDSDRPVLSQVLREAKQKTEETEKNLKAMQKHLYKKQIHFETLFDDYHGLVHLEALEMLSKQSSLKLQSLLAPLSGKALQDLQETLSEVRELCELPDSDSDDADGLHTSLDLKEKLDTATEDLGVVVEFNEIIRYKYYVL